ATTAAACHPTGRSGIINTINNRRQVGPLQAIAPGPVQAIVFRRWMTTSGICSWANSTACAWRS
ncbi:MAG: hypothetical protein ACLPZR_33695, partial [Solirubrobacteraceae bacterium]